MPVDRNLKKKKKREAKQKARRRQAHHEMLLGKAEEQQWQATEAFDAQEYGRALNLAQKVLKVDPSNQMCRQVGIHSAEKLGNRAVVLRLLHEGFVSGDYTSVHNCLVIARLGVEQKDYILAQQMCELLLREPARLNGRVTKRQVDEAKQILQYARVMERQQGKGAEQSRGMPAPGRQVTGEGDPSGECTSPEADARTCPAEGFEPVTTENLPRLDVVVRTDAARLNAAVQEGRRTTLNALERSLAAYRFSFRTSYDQLICLPGLKNVQSLWYQEETARKVMKSFRGRAILADEVGLGKTIEAGIILKEYMLRGLVRTALILTPSSLVRQWQEELKQKFDIHAASSQDDLIRQDPDKFWNEPVILASIHTAKLKRHFDAVVGRSYDMVIVDEAHHLKNRTTLAWKLVNAVRKSFLLMLTATPVQNNLEELFNLVTLLQPGHLKTRKAFMDEFVSRGNPMDPQNREKLRLLLKEVMVRNTRSVTRLHLPPRFAYTVRVAPSDAESRFYEGVTGLVRRLAAETGGAFSRQASRRMLEMCGSSHVAGLAALRRVAERGDHGLDEQLEELEGLAGKIGVGGKAARVLELLESSPHQKIVFVNYTATLDYLSGILDREGIAHVVYRGGLTPAEKAAVMSAFRDGCRVLLATGSGGEGFNLQFCHMMINFDLPWNPMEIEQRIGRIHRLGQEEKVQVFNFCQAGTLEDHILELLDRKINMFELVIGEIDMILGRMQGEEDFGDLVYDIWLQHADEAGRRRAFDALGARLKRARSSYEKSKELDEKLFREDFGV